MTVLHGQGGWNEHAAGEQGYEDCEQCRRTPKSPASETAVCPVCGHLESRHNGPLYCLDCPPTVEQAAEFDRAQARQESPASEPEHWRDDPTGWERAGEGYTSYGTDVIWSHPFHGSQVVSLGIERAIAAHFALEQYDLLKARAERAEERLAMLETARDYLLSVMEQLHRDAHDALAEARYQ